MNFERKQSIWKLCLKLDELNDARRWGLKADLNFTLRTLDQAIFIVMFRFLLVTVEIFEFSGPRTTCFSVARLHEVLISPAVTLQKMRPK
jgi:hypothetical protein